MGRACCFASIEWKKCEKSEETNKRLCLVVFRPAAVSGPLPQSGCKDGGKGGGLLVSGVNDKGGDFPV
jgi:hypothetical protein